jgi:acyl-CoA thioesterase
MIPGPTRYINPDLTIYLHLYPRGEWVCLDAVTRVEAHGVGLAESRLYDRDGRIGRAVQSLIIEQVS